MWLPRLALHLLCMSINTCEPVFIQYTLHTDIFMAQQCKSSKLLPACLPLRGGELQRQTNGVWLHTWGTKRTRQDERVALCYLAVTYFPTWTPSARSEGKYRLTVWGVHSQHLLTKVEAEGLMGETLLLENRSVEKRRADVQPNKLCCFTSRLEGKTLFYAQWWPMDSCRLKTDFNHEANTIHVCLRILKTLYLYWLQPFIHSTGLSFMWMNADPPGKMLSWYRTVQNCKHSLINTCTVFLHIEIHVCVTRTNLPHHHHSQRSIPPLSVVSISLILRWLAYSFGFFFIYRKDEGLKFSMH